MVEKVKGLAALKRELAIVSTKLDDHCKTQRDDMDRIYGALKSIEGKFDNLDHRYVTKSEFITHDEQIKELKSSKRNTIPTIASVASILMMLITLIIIVGKGG
jgi:hypothetical protein